MKLSEVKGQKREAKKTNCLPLNCRRCSVEVRWNGKFLNWWAEIILVWLKGGKKEIRQEINSTTSLPLCWIAYFRLVLFCCDYLIRSLFGEIVKWNTLKIEKKKDNSLFLKFYIKNRRLHWLFPSLYPLHLTICSVKEGNRKNANVSVYLIARWLVGPFSDLITNAEQSYKVENRCMHTVCSRMHTSVFFPAV